MESDSVEENESYHSLDYSCYLLKILAENLKICANGWIKLENKTPPSLRTVTRRNPQD